MITAFGADKNGRLISDYISSGNKQQKFLPEQPSEMGHLIQSHHHSLKSYRIRKCRSQCEPVCKHTAGITANNADPDQTAP